MKIRLKKLNQHGFDHATMLVVFVVAFALVGSYLLYHSIAATTYVELHLGRTNGYCVTGTTVADCNSNANNQRWATMSGSNFQVRNAAGECLDDWNGSKVYTSLRTGKCYSNDTHQQFNWSNHRLVNRASGYCINADQNNMSPGDLLIIYKCTNTSNEEFFETSISSGVPSSGQASSICRRYGYSTTACNAVGIGVSYVGSHYGSWNNVGQLTCLGELWNAESGWLWYASNPSSGAYGIPQSLPGSKMASMGSDWRTNPLTQIKWGLSYIKSIYGSPCNAWASELRNGGY